MTNPTPNHETLDKPRHPTLDKVLTKVDKLVTPKPKEGETPKDFLRRKGVIKY